MHGKNVKTAGGDYLVCLTLSSRLTREMLATRISRECKRACVFTENLKNGRRKGLPMIVIHDWRDLASRKFVAGQPGREEAAPTHPEAYVIVNMAKGEEEQIPTFFDCRKVRGLFYAEEVLDTFIKGLNRILNGEIWVPRTVMLGWMDVSVSENVLPAKNHLLSSRQMSILKFITQGMSNMEIAKKLGISCNTVKAHIYNIFKLISVSNRIQAAQWAASYLYEYPAWLRN